MQESALDLGGKRILVTGATSDIGGAIARACAAQGARLAVTGRNEVRLARLREELAGSIDVAAALDLADGDALPLLAKALEAFSPLSGFVHAAGHHALAPVRMLNREKLSAAMAINYLAPVEIAKLVSARGKFDPAGCSLVFISSIAAHHAQAGLLAYSASKSALSRAAAGLARELAPKGIRVNSIVPGWVHTAAAERAQASMSEEERRHHIAQYPLGLGRPEDIAAASLFLLSGMSRWVTGAELFVDGGFNA